MKLAVIIPCLNEANSIRQTILAVKETVPYGDIYIVDNGSSDATVEIAESLSTYILREPQRGKGFAVRRGITGIPNVYDFYFIVDGDDTYDIEPLKTALALLEFQGYDMVVGKRVNEPNLNDQRTSQYRFGHVTGNKLLSGSFRILFRIPITDTLSGWRVMTRSFVRSFAGGASGFDIEAEFNVHCYTLSAAVVEIPVNYRGRLTNSDSKLRTYKDGVVILRRNFRLFRSERPLIAYSLLALPWLFSGLLLLNRVFQTYQKIQLVPQFPSLITGVGLIVISCNLWVTGMILEKTRQIRVSMSRFYFSENSRLR